MCKIASVAKITDKNRKDVWAFMIALGEFMSSYNKDGLGYAAFDKSGNLFGEKWLRNHLAFTDFSEEKYLTPLKIERLYSFFGDKVLKQEAQAIIFHTRAATCGIGIENTHPFVNDKDKPTSVIIHNGMIANHDEHLKKYSTCDSEVLVHLYDKHKVNQNLDNIKQVTPQLLGWYTVLALAKNAEGKMIMDVFTDAPRLNSFYIEELETRVYSTSAQDIKAAAKIFGYTCKDHEQIRADSAFRVDVLTGEATEAIKTTGGKFKYTRKPIFPTVVNGQLVYAEGNFDDEEFQKKWLRRITDV